MNEEPVRERLMQYLTSRGFRPLEEISLASNNNRIDVVGMKNGVLCGFEIKSEADTLGRLKPQASCYRRYFEQLYLVGAEGHLEGATQMLPHYWGIWAVRPSASGVHIVRRAPPARSARANKHQKAAPLAELMRRTELLELLSANVPSSGLEELSRKELARKCAERYGIREIEHHLFEALHARKRARLALIGAPLWHGRRKDGIAVA